MGELQPEVCLESCYKQNFIKQNGPLIIIFLKNNFTFDD